MQYADIIARGIDSLPLEKQAEVLDEIEYLKVKQRAILVRMPSGKEVELSGPTLNSTQQSESSFRAGGFS